MRKENGSESLGFSALSCKSLGQISCFPNLNMNGKMGAGVLELFNLAGQTFYLSSRARMSAKQISAVAHLHTL